MKFDLTVDQKMIQEMLHKFAVKELDPVANEMDIKGEFPLKILKKLAELEVTALVVPEDAGGAGADTLSLVLTLEELAQYWAAVAFTLLNHNVSLYAIAQCGQQTALLEPMAEGQKWGALAFLEPDGGFDELRINTRAEQEGQDYLISGTKVLVPGSEHTDVLVLFAQTAEDQLGCFLVETGQIKMIPQPYLLGLKGACCARLSLDRCRVPSSALLATMPAAGGMLTQILDVYRIGLAAMAVGMSRQAFALSLQYSKERNQFGRPIGSFPMLQEKIINMAQQIPASRFLVYDAALKRDQGKLTHEVPLALLAATATAISATTDAVQVHGGNGYTKDYPLERYMRDAQVLRMAGGTSEVLSCLAAQEIWRS